MLSDVVEELIPEYLSKSGHQQLIFKACFQICNSMMHDLLIANVITNCAFIRWAYECEIINVDNGWRTVYMNIMNKGKYQISPDNIHLIGRKRKLKFADILQIPNDFSSSSTYTTSEHCSSNEAKDYIHNVSKVVHIIGDYRGISQEFEDKTECFAFLFYCNGGNTGNCMELAYNHFHTCLNLRYPNSKMLTNHMNSTTAVSAHATTRMDFVR